MRREPRECPVPQLAAALLLASLLAAAVLASAVLAALLRVASGLALASPALASVVLAGLVLAGLVLAGCDPLCSGAWQLGRMDRLGGGPGDGDRNLLISCEQGLGPRQDEPDRRLGSRAQIARPDLGWHPADMFVRIAARQPRERLVYPVQAQV